MLPIISKRIVTGLAYGLLAVFGSYAKNGAPHSLVVEPNYTDVKLTWCAPEASKELK